MRRIGILGLLLAAASPAAALEAPTCPAEPMTDIVHRLADLPDDIRANVLADGRTVDAGQPYSEWDRPENYALPVRRLVRAGHAGDRWFVWLEYGMLMRHDEILGFRTWGGGWQRTITWQGDPCLAVHAFMAGVEDAVGYRTIPLVYKDPGSGILFFVGRDGRHLTAVDPDGRIRWDVDPFAEGHLDPYRTNHPLIRFLGPGPSGLTGIRPDEVISVGFNSSQSGVVSIADGSFEFMGQD